MRTVDGKFKLWFFQALTDEQRTRLFSLYGMPVEGITTHGGQSLALAYLAPQLVTAPEAKSEGAVKALEWHKLYPDNTMYPMDWHGKGAFNIIYAVIQYSNDGQYFALGKGYETLEKAKATAQADYETRILSALVIEP